MPRPELPPKRKSTEVTADRLLAHYERNYDQLTDQEREAFGIVRSALHRLADAPKEN